eukprot:581501-Amphidinium_carterae.2
MYKLSIQEECLQVSMKRLHFVWLSTWTHSKTLPEEYDEDNEFIAHGEYPERPNGEIIMVPDDPRRQTLRPHRRTTVLLHVDIGETSPSSCEGRACPPNVETMNRVKQFEDLGLLVSFDPTAESLLDMGKT